MTFTFLLWIWKLTVVDTFCIEHEIKPKEELMCKKIFVFTDRVPLMFGWLAEAREQTKAILIGPWRTWWITWPLSNVRSCWDKNRSHYFALAVSDVPVFFLSSFIPWRKSYLKACKQQNFSDAFSREKKGKNKASHKITSKQKTVVVTGTLWYNF